MDKREQGKSSGHKLEKRVQVKTGSYGVDKGEQMNGRQLWAGHEGAEEGQWP